MRREPIARFEIVGGGPADSALLAVWRFVLGDTAPEAFEAWACSEAGIEARMGTELFLEVISTDYRDPHRVHEVRQRLFEWASAFAPPSCWCFSVPDPAVLDMGDDHLAVFATFVKESTRGALFWWLSTYRCSSCDARWLVAQEERQNDVFCMRRLGEGEAASIRSGRGWPKDFDRYEGLLEMGLSAGRSVRFADPMRSSLPWTIRDLAAAQPGIRVSTLARLLNLDPETAHALARVVARREGAVIEFDAR